MLVFEHLMFGMQPHFFITEVTYSTKIPLLYPIFVISIYSLHADTIIEKNFIHHILYELPCELPCSFYWGSIVIVEPLWPLECKFRCSVLKLLAVIKSRFISSVEVVVRGWQGPRKSFQSHVWSRFTVKVLTLLSGCVGQGPCVS